MRHMRVPHEVNVRGRVIHIENAAVIQRDHIIELPDVCAHHHRGVGRREISRKAEERRSTTMNFSSMRSRKSIHMPTW